MPIPVPPFTQADKIKCQTALRELHDAALVLPKCAQCGVNVDDMQSEISSRINMLEKIQQLFMGHLACLPILLPSMAGLFVVSELLQI